MSHSALTLLSLSLHTQSNMGSMWRSQPMELCEMFLQSEVAYDVLSVVGKMVCRPLHFSAPHHLDRTLFSSSMFVRVKLVFLYHHL